MISMSAHNPTRMSNSTRMICVKRSIGRRQLNHARFSDSLTNAANDGKLYNAVAV